MIKLTIFNSQFDNKTDKCISLANFDQFEKMLYGLSKQPKKGKKDAELISPAVYEPGTTRANKNVTAWAGWCAVDVDDIEVDGELDAFVRNLIPGWRFVCYSTASSRPTKKKFRLVFELDRHIPVAEIKHFWFALQSSLDESGDKQCKDLSRMYYIPATYDEADNFIFSNRNGDPIDPDELMFKHEYHQKSNLNNFFDRLPEAIQEQIIEHRKQKLDNTNITWSSYRDCPFFPKKLEAEYRLINNTGWYHKMYQIMVAIAGNAIKRNYPITSAEISKMCRELDMETGNWYENRPLDKEADRALEYVYKNM